MTALEQARTFSPGIFTRALPVACALLAFFVLSCKKPGDEQAPEILSVATTEMQHGAGLHAFAGKVNKIDISARDNEGLSKLKCRLTNIGDFHLHTMHEGATQNAFRAPNIGIWEAEKSLDIAGTAITETLKFSAPDTVSGQWTIEVTAMDLVGNIDFYTNTVLVQNDSIPAIIPTATHPAARADGVIEVPVGTSFTMEGNIVDGDWIESVTILVYSPNSLVWEQTWTPENTWMFDLSQITVPNFDAAGTYTFELHAKDRGEWRSYVVATIEAK